MTELASAINRETSQLFALLGILNTDGSDVSSASLHRID